MKIAEIVVSRSIKLSHQYNSVGSEISVKAVLEEGDDVDTVYRELSEHVQHLLGVDISNQLDFLMTLRGGDR